MKKILLTLFVFVTSVVEASPYYRIWRGYKKDNLSTEVFNKAIQDVFVSATVENGAGNSLLAYIPALPKAVDGYTVPDEIALVVYESKEKYDVLKATPAGTAYTALHWEYFTRAPVNPQDLVPANISKSNVPTVLTQEIAAIENGQAYDFLGSTPDWQKGLVKIRFLKRNADASLELEHLRKIQKDFAPKSQAFLLLADEQYFMSYELWKDEETLKDSGIETFLSENFKNLGNENTDNQIVAQKTGKNISEMQNLSLPQGAALNAQFDINEKSEYVAKDQVEAFVEMTLKKSYATFVDYNLMEEEDTENTIQRKYLVRYEDEAGLPALHSEEVLFLLKKSLLQPEQKFLVIKKAEPLH